MSRGQTLNRLLTVLLILLPLWLLALLFRWSWLKGLLGEQYVRFILKFSLNAEDYLAVHNVTLATESGSTQIDHIVVSRYGVFVIETKNMKGWIYGTEFQKQWTQKIYKYSGTFQNPLHQNYKHTETLQQLLGLEKQQIFSVVVFVGDSTFKTVMPVNVVYGRGLVGYLKMQQRAVFSDEQVLQIIDQIETGRLKASLTTDLNHHAHIQTIKQVAEDKYTKHPEQNTPLLTTELGPSCPECGDVMVRRVGRRGQYQAMPFWGCSSFPSCRTIRSIPTEEF